MYSPINVDKHPLVNSEDLISDEEGQGKRARDDFNHSIIKEKLFSQDDVNTATHSEISSVIESDSDI